MHAACCLQQKLSGSIFVAELGRSVGGAGLSTIRNVRSGKLKCLRAEPRLAPRTTHQNAYTVVDQPRPAMTLAWRVGYSMAECATPSNPRSKFRGAPWQGLDWRAVSAMGRAAFLIVNQAGYPVFHDTSNSHMWSAATQVWRHCKAKCIALTICGTALHGQIHAIWMQMKASMGQSVRHMLRLPPVQCCSDSFAAEHSVPSHKKWARDSSAAGYRRVPIPCAQPQR
jgi:hypothetical protein